MSGAVWLATSKTTKEKFAAKSIVLSRMEAELLDDLRNEIALLRDVRDALHPRDAVCRHVTAARRAAGRFTTA